MGECTLIDLISQSSRIPPSAQVCLAMDPQMNGLSFDGVEVWCYECEGVLSMNNNMYLNIRCKCEDCCANFEKKKHVALTNGLGGALWAWFK